MRFYVKASRGTDTLCRGCENSMIVRTTAGETIVNCTYYGSMTPVREPVAECSGFDPKGAMSKHQMERIAWHLEIKDRRVIGFKPPRPNQWRELKDLDEEVSG